MTLFRKPLLAVAAPSFTLLVLVTLVGTIGTHIFGPAMPQAARDIGVTPSAMQLTLTIYLVGFAFGHLFYGPLADAFGRRPVVLGALALYTLAALGSALADSLGGLLAARLCQALAGAAGPVVGRAMIRDVSDAKGATRQLAFLGLVMSGSPALSPVIGGYVTALLGWRWIFYGLTVFGVAMLLMCLLVLPETRRTGDLPAKQPRLIEGIGVLLRSRLYVGYAFGGALSVGSTYAFLAAAPFIYGDLLQIRADHVGLYYLLLMLGLSAGSFIAGRLAGRISNRSGAICGALCGVASAFLLLAVDLTHEVNVLTVTLPMMLLVFGNGMVMPNVLTGAMSVDLRFVAAASGLFGFLMQGTGALCTVAISAWYDGSVRPTALLLILVTLAGHAILHYGTRAARGGAGS